MRVIHQPAADRDGTTGERAVLADRAEVADGLVQKGVGLMFRRSIPEGYALAFRFDRAKPRSIHMVCVFFALDVVWVRDGVVERVERLPPWRGFARARGDLVIEFPAGRAEGVEPGDTIRLEAE